MSKLVSGIPMLRFDDTSMKLDRCHAAYGYIIFQRIMLIPITVRFYTMSAFKILTSFSFIKTKF